MNSSLSSCINYICVGPSWKLSAEVVRRFKRIMHMYDYNYAEMYLHKFVHVFVCTLKKPIMMYEYVPK